MKPSFFKPFCLLILFISGTYSHSQNTIKPKKGFTPQIGITVAMLEDLKTRVTRSVENLDQNGTDFLLDDEANRIGAMILHLAATEKYYQVYTFENRGFTNEEGKIWELPLNLGANARKKYVGKPIDHYLKIWDDVRKETLRLLKTKDDTWFAKKTARGSMNNHWAWYHVMEHQANHMGQIRMIAKRIP